MPRPPDRTMTTNANEPQQLTRGLGLLDATMIVVGSMIGSGIFVVSSTSARLVGAPGWLLLAWVLASVLTITGSICCAELAGMYPQAGGVYVFFRNAYHPVVGFVFGWAMLLVIQTATIAAVAIAFAKFLGVLAPGVASNRYLVEPIALGSYALSLSTQQLVAIAVILVLTYANTHGLRTGKLIQNTFTLTKTAALFGLIVLGLLLGWNSDAAAFTSNWWNPWANGWTTPLNELGELPKWLALSGGVALAFLFGKAMTGPLFAQTAWNNVTFTGSEVRSPEKNLPRALILGCATVVVLYLLANVAYVVSLPLGSIQYAEEGRVGTEALKAVFSRFAGAADTAARVMAVLIMISTFGCINGLILAGAHLLRPGPRWPVFPADRGGQPPPRPRPGPVAAGHLVGPADPAADGPRRSRKRTDPRRRLRSAAQLPGADRRNVLRADGGRGDRAALEGAGCAASLPHLGLSRYTADLSRAGHGGDRAADRPVARPVRDRLPHRAERHPDLLPLGQAN